MMPTVGCNSAIFHERSSHLFKMRHEQTGQKLQEWEISSQTCRGASDRMRRPCVLTVATWLSFYTVLITVRARL